MNIAKFFIDRKVLTWTLSLVFFVAGVTVLTEGRIVRLTDEAPSAAE